MRITGLAGIVSVLVALLAVLNEPAVQALIPAKYVHWVFVATTLIAAVTKAVKVERKSDEDKPTPGVHNA